MKRNTRSKKLLSIIVITVICGLALQPANAETITTYENWERLEFRPGERFRLYSAGEFNQAIPEWQANSSSSYGVEHQHSGITWGQTNSNDDFLELDLSYSTPQPQIFTGFQTDPDEELTSVSISFDAAGRPDLNERRDLVLYGRENSGSWNVLESFSILGGGSQFPVFSEFSYVLSFTDAFTGLFEFGFGCSNCETRPGYGPLLGDVTARYNVDAAGGSAPVPEPSSMLLLGAATAGILRKKNKLSNRC